MHASIFTAFSQREIIHINAMQLLKIEEWKFLAYKN